MKVVIFAGGSGGHIYPALAILNKIKVNYYDLTNDFNEHTFNDSTLHDYIGINFGPKNEHITTKKVRYLFSGIGPICLVKPY